MKKKTISSVQRSVFSSRKPRTLWSRSAVLHPSSFILHPSGNRGIALVLTLGILAIVTLLVIAFATSMRVENMASKNFNDLIKARELANAAVDHAVATIREATPIRTQSVPPLPLAFTTYATFPGAIWDFNYNGVVSAVTPYALYSWNVNGADQFDFNAPPQYWITSGNGEFPGVGPGANAAINVGWIYVAKDGSIGTAPFPGNPEIIGRFAFWVDDEASKININSAGVPPAPDPLGSSNPQDVDLGAAALYFNNAAFPAAIVARRALPYLYTTIEEVKRAQIVAPFIGDDYFTANRFSTTAFSDDAYYPAYTADLDAFDRQRKNISTLISAGAGNDFSAVAGVDSAYNRLADTALARICSPPAGPVVVGTFAGKYPLVGGVNGLQQIIANIIAYQHDPQNAADPTPYPPDAADDVVGTPPTYLGLARAPYVNEVQVSYADDGNGTLTRTVRVELFYPYAADAAYVSGPAGLEDQIVIDGIPTPTAPAGTFNAAFPVPAPITINVPAGTTFNAVGFYYVTLNGGAPNGYQDTATLNLPPGPPPAWPAGPAINIPAGTIKVNYQRANALGVYHRLDCALVPLPATVLNIPWAPIPPNWAGPTVWQGAEVNDPCVNENTAAWTSYVNPAGTLVAPNNQNSVYAPPGGDVSKMRIRGGNMLSIGELGYIHRPTAWTYLTLQPQPAAEKPNQIPDWAMLDIFTVGAANTRGRININSSINPGGVAALPSLSPGTPRQVPLKALLNTLGLLPAVALDIYNDNVAARTSLPSNPGGLDPYGVGYVFDTIGEICEVGSLIPAGAANEAAKEATIRRIANLITTRSNAFTIWVKAQSIKQPTGAAIGTFTPGIDLITGEVRAQAVVERYEFPALPLPPTAVKFRTRYFRYIYE